MDLQVLTTEFLASKAAAGRAGTTVDFYYWQFKGRYAPMMGCGQHQRAIMFQHLIH